MSKEKSAINAFQKYLTVWVILCMVVGVLIGKYLPGIPQFLNQFEYAKVSIPMAILIWLMIYPMMMKVDFQSIKNVGKNPKGLFVTWITNWLIKPFTMYGIASLFFFVIFKAFITPDLATEYLAGAVLLGAAPCTAMVFVWSSLTKGDPAYTVVQVATNDLIRTQWQIRCAFNGFCKRTLKNEVLTAHRDIKRHQLREVSFSDLTPQEENQLYTYDTYFADDEAEKSFCVAGKEITAKLLADALHSLPEEKREAILLYYFFGMNDAEIAMLRNVPRSTIQYRRTSSFELLKRYLEERAYDENDW